MLITLKDIPVQRTFSSAPKPLFKEELIVKDWIVKSKSLYLVSVLSVEKSEMGPSAYA